MAYISGRVQAVEMLEAGFTLRECLRFAQIIMEHRSCDETAKGFMDAIMERC